MDNPEYYEQYNWEKSRLKEKLKDKVDLLKKLIPPDVNTIADIGCGDGAITNELGKHFRIFAVDRSFNALRYVSTAKIQGSADSLPFKIDKVDLLFSSEMLEHLPNNIFNKTVEEFAKTSRKYLLLTFPDDENIEKNFVKCTNCGYVFNKSYHLRTINLEIIAKLFPNFRILTHFSHGKKIREYNKTLSKIKHKIVSPKSWIPSYWTPDGRRETMCPNCNKTFTIPYKFSLVGYFIELLNILVTKKRPYQLFVLMEKSN